jgi:hypothetical protein
MGQMLLDGRYTGARPSRKHYQFHFLINVSSPSLKSVLHQLPVGHVALWDCDHFHETKDWISGHSLITAEFWESPGRFGLWYLKSISTIFHLYRSGQFSSWRKPECPEKTIKDLEFQF